MKITFEEALKEYYKYSYLKLKKSNYEEQKRKIEKHILSFFRNKNIYEIEFKDIISWKLYIEKNNYKYNYKSYIFYCLTSVFDFFVRFYNIEKNYAKIIGNFKNNDIKETGNIWTIEEYQKFINNVDDIKYKILFELLFYTGVRKGEILALKWKDIDFNNNKININKTITRNHELQPPKTRSSYRTISISNNLSKELKKIYNNNLNDFIFNISFTQLKRKKDFYCKKANVKQIKIHEFRHSHACFLFKNKIEIEDISYRLGHSNINMTMTTYLNYLPKNEKRVIKLLNSIKC